MNAWEPPKLSDLKATPAPVRRARNTFDLLGDPLESEEQAARSDISAKGSMVPAPAQTERVLLGGRVVEVITGSPPPIRREASPVRAEVQPPTLFAGMSLDNEVEDEDEFEDALFEAWTVEPVTRRDERMKGDGRRSLAVFGLVAVAVAGLAIWGMSGSTGQEDPARPPVAAASVTQAAVPVVDVAAAEDLKPMAAVQPTPPAQEPAPEAPVASKRDSKAALTQQSSVRPLRPAVAPAPLPEEKVETIDRSTLYTPSASAPPPVEVPQAVPEKTPEPELAPAPETSGTNPWGAPPPVEAAPVAAPTGTDPWGAQE